MGRQTCNLQLLAKIVSPGLFFTEKYILKKNNLSYAHTNTQTNVMSTQKFTHFLLSPQCKSQPSSCLQTNLKYWNQSCPVFAPLLWSFLQQPQHARSHSCCDWTFFLTFYNGSFLLWQVRVLVSSWEHRPPQESLALTRLWPQHVTSSGPAAEWRGCGGRDGFGSAPRTIKE